MPEPRTVATMIHRPCADLKVMPVSVSVADHHCRPPALCPALSPPRQLVTAGRHATKAARNGTSCMATTLWDQLRQRALSAVELGADPDTAARDLLAASGGDRRAVLAAHMRAATETADATDVVDAPDELRARRVLDLLRRAIVMGDTEGLWHPVYGDLDPWQFARHHASN
jgi:hypothetical protein